MIKFLKIAIWNANGLTNHAQEVKAFILIHNIDIMLISETHFTNRSYLRIPNYAIYNTKHPDGTAHGGTAIIIKSSIKHHELNKFKRDYIQATSISIEDWNGPLTVTAIYSPPRHTIAKNQYQEFFNTLGNRFLAGGDYNAKHTHWGSRLITPKGRQLYMAMETNNLKYISTGEPTYWPTDTNKIPDLVDFCVTKGIPLESQTAQSCFDLSSDHSPVLVMISTNILETQPPPYLSSKYTNWIKFRAILDERLDLNIPLKSDGEIDEAVNQLNRIIQEAGWQSTPKQPRTIIHKDLPNEIKEKIAEKRRLRKVWQRTRAPQDKNRLNQATARLKTLLNNNKNNDIKRYLQNLSATETSEYSLWKATRKINRPQLSNPPIRASNGRWAKSNNEKATVFAKYLEEVFQPHAQNNNSDAEDNIQLYLEYPYQLEAPLEKFTAKQVFNKIQTDMNPKKSPGFDLITARILKELPKKGVQYLTQIFNAILRTGYYPLLWKVAQIILIPKPGKPVEEVKSYRPISLLSVMSKVFEKLLLDRLQPILVEKQLIPNHQFGFRQQHATTEQIHRVCNSINKALEEKQYCSAAFLDVSQAFDKVWHTGLLYKIRKVLPLNYFLILKSYLSDRHFLVKVKDQCTNLYPINAGVPQGSVLGPVLYLLYTADLPTSQNIITATYADDTAIIAAHSNPYIASQLLQTNLDSINIWLQTWRIKVNESKSVHITFTNRKDTCPTVSINNQVLQQKDDVKYLGMHLDRRLTWKKHIFTKRKQLGLKLNKMYWLIGKRSQLSLYNKILVYKAVIKPIWSYGIQLWGSASRSNIDILERFQSKTLRIITNAPWYMPNEHINRDLQMKTVKEEIASYAQKYDIRLQNHPNRLAKNLMRPQANRRLKRHTPSDLRTRF